MTKLCICQICNCGRHRCPHNNQRLVNKGDQPCSLTEYARKYISHPLEMRPSMKPEHKASGNQGPLEDKTTHRVDYIPHPYEKPFVRPAEQYVAPEGALDGMTNYTKEYTKKPIARSQPIRHDQNRKEPGKFSGDPTYKADYRKFSAERTKPIIREQQYRPNSNPFEGHSNYTDDYIRHCAAPRESMRPVQKPNMSDEPFAKDTGYRTDYTNKPMPPRERKEKETYKANKAPFDSATNYTKEYVPKDFQNVQSCKPTAGAYQSDAPMNDQTTHRVDYTPKPYEKPWVRQANPYVTPEGNFDFNTTHKREYTPKPLNKTQSTKPTARKSEPGKFDDGTNYKKDFRKWPLGQKPEYKNKSEYVPNDARFEGLPTYTHDYIKYNERPRESMKPSANPNLSQEPFTGLSEYKDDYTKKQMPERFRRDVQKYTPNKAPFEGQTNYLGDYVRKDLNPQPSCKPDNAAYQSSAPLEDKTTFRTDYQKWPMSRPFVHEPDRYVQPEGNMEKDTTTRLAYTPKAIEKTQSKKPAVRKSDPGKFQDCTTQKDDFRKWGLGERERPKMKDEYVPNSAPFQGTSNYTDDYIKHPHALRMSLKPNEKGLHSDAPFEGGTEYKLKYTGKTLPPCPAGVIEAGGNPNPGFNYLEQDPSGHKWYQAGAGSGVIDLKPPGMGQAAVTKQMTAVC